MYAPHENLRRRATTAAALTALTVLSAGACGSDDSTATSSSRPPQTPVDTTVAPTDDEGIARAALLQPVDIGDGWQDYGPASAFPMTSELAASVPSCAPFVDVVFDGNTGAWASTALGRNMDIVFTSVTVFPTNTEAAAMIAATATPEFDQCWADFNEAATIELPFGITSATYTNVEPPVLELGGNSSSLHALDGTITLGSTNVPDTCVCAFVQQGRTVVAFHSAAPVFTTAERNDVIAAALARVDEMVE